MILTLTFVVVFILGIYEKLKSDSDDDVAGVSTFFLTLIGFVGTLACVVVIICSHTRIDYQIEKNRLEYESLLAQYEAVEDDSATFVLTEMFSVYDKVYEWNKGVLVIRHASHSLLSNWFYDKRVVEDLKFIGREE